MRLPSTSDRQRHRVHRRYSTAAIGAQQDERWTRARAADRSHLASQRVLAAALWPGALARRRHRLHHRRARHRRRRRLRHRPLRRRHRRAQHPDLQHAADPGRLDTGARHRRLRVVGRWLEAVDLHEHAEGLAPEHARRLLGVDDQGRRAEAGGHDATAGVADVREVLAGCDARRLRARQQPLRRAAGRRQGDATDDRRIGNDINGTSDWVYEEEFGVRDGFRFSPDGKSIVYWQFDSTGVGIFSLINNTDSLYPVITKIPYPKAGTTNSAARVGVVERRGRRDDVDQDRRRSAQHLSRAHRLDRFEHRRRSSNSIASRIATTS